MHTQVRGLFALFLIAGTAHVAMAQNPNPHANSQKYRDNGAKPATGRSGSATLEARALMSRDGTMQVEASTGSLEQGTHPGSIAKVQLKTPAFVQNYNNLAGNGYWSASYPTAARHTAIQVQANVRGIDPKRTDVVTVSTPVRLRPDVKVHAVEGPAQAAPQTPVHFTASISEINGDVGARAACVLSVDGTPVLTNQGIWIDAAGTVSCVFDYTFTEAGTYTVRVSVNDVVPADWDASNNQAETSITILAPGQKIQQGSFQAAQINYLQRYSYGYNYDYSYTYDYSYAYMWGATQAKAERVQRVDAMIHRDGAIAHNVSLTPSNVSEYNDGSYSQHCSTYDNWTQTQFPDGRWEYTSSGDFMQLCSSGNVNDPSSYSSSFYYQRISGEIIYDYSQSGWYYNTQRYTYGTGADLGWNAGATIRLKINFVDVIGAMFDADRSVVLEDQSHQVNYSNWYGNELHTSSGRYYFGFINWQQ